jgi:hypothetical protein
MTGKKLKLGRSFKKAKVNWPWLPPTRISTELPAAAVNSKLERGLGSQGHRAMEEIRRALILIECPAIPHMRFDNVPRGSRDWSDGDKAVWKRFWLWQDQMFREDVKAREATILFAKGHRIYEIEETVKVRRGVGKAKAMIFHGAKVYCDILNEFV